MPQDSSSDPQAPQAAHVAETVEVIAAFQRAHEESATRLQKTMDGVTERLGRPALVAFVIAGIAAWIGATLALGSGDVAQPSFTWLELAATVFALLVAMLILVTQRRQDRLSERRAQLTLELAIVADRKTAKLIALMEEFRRDHPDLRDREDRESREMAQPTDAQTVMAAIEERAATAKEGRPASFGARRPGRSRDRD